MLMNKNYCQEFQIHFDSKLITFLQKWNNVKKCQIMLNNTKYCQIMSINTKNPNSSNLIRHQSRLLCLFKFALQKLTKIRGAMVAERSRALLHGMGAPWFESHLLFFFQTKTNRPEAILRLLNQEEMSLVQVRGSAGYMVVSPYQIGFYKGWPPLDSVGCRRWLDSNWDSKWKMYFE